MVISFTPILVGTLAVAAASRTASDPNYWRDVRPVFTRHCTVCHNPRNLDKKDQGGGLSLATFDSFMKDRTTPVIVPGNSRESRLYQLLTSDNEDKRMPLDADPLPKADIELIRRWIDGGAKEGERPRRPETEPLAQPGPRRPARRLGTREVRLPSKVTLPEDLARDLKLAGPGPLDATLKVGPLAPVSAVAFTPDGKQLAVGGHGHVVLWDLAVGRPIRELDTVGTVHAIAYNADGSRLATAGGLAARAGEVRVFETQNWQLVATLPEHGDVVYDLDFSPDSKLLATASFDKTVKVWTLTDSRPIQTLKGHSDFAYRVAFTPDGKRLVSSSKDRSIKVYSTSTWQSERTLSGHNDDVLALALSRDSTYAISAGREPQLRWWVLDSGQNLRVQGGHKGTVNEVAVSRDGNRVASVGADATVRLWDAKDGRLLQSMTLPESEWLYCVAFSADARFVAAGSGNGVVYIGDVATASHRLTLLNPPAPQPGTRQWLAFAPEGYYDASEELAGLLQWRVGAHPVVSDAVASVLRRSDVGARALRGEPFEPPQFVASK